MTLLAPGAICRLDDRLLGQIRRGEDLRGVVLSAILTILLGSGAYGVAFGIWRGSAQALYSAVKLPALLLAIAACTIGLGAMVALLLRSRLSLRQTTVCILLSLAVTSAVLGATAPISILVGVIAPPPDPSVVGLPIDDLRVQPSLAVARGLLLIHVVAIACAGMAGVVRLRGLLGKLGLGTTVARRVLVSWMAAQFLVGAQLSWLFRPFFGRPHLPASWSCDDLLDGNFFEEVATSMRSAFGDEAPLVLALAEIAITVTLMLALRAKSQSVVVAIGEAGLLVDGGPRMVPWNAIAEVRGDGGEVKIELAADETLARDVLTVGCRDENDASDLALRIDTERARVRAGPFRTSAARDPR